MTIIKSLRTVFIALTLSIFSAMSFAAPVNINLADAETLAENIKGVGLKKANSIIMYRKTHGPFKNVNELTNVKGIGSKLVSNNKEVLFVNDKIMSRVKKN